jgi:hypothetical protein
MAVLSIEERMTALEAEVARLKRQMMAQSPQADIPWWERRFGAFQDDPLYDQAARLGAEYRKAQPTPADDDASA